MMRTSRSLFSVAAAKFMPDDFTVPDVADDSRTSLRAASMQLCKMSTLIFAAS